MNRGLPYSFLLCMAGYGWTSYRSGTTGLVRLTCSSVLPGGAYTNQRTWADSREVKTAGMCFLQVEGSGVWGRAGRVIVGDGTENEQRRDGQAKSCMKRGAPPSSG